MYTVTRQEKRGSWGIFDFVHNQADHFGTNFTEVIIEPIKGIRTFDNTSHIT